MRRPEDWRWSSARAHLTGQGDGLTAIDALGIPAAEWREFLDCGLNDRKDQLHIARRQLQLFFQMCRRCRSGITCDSLGVHHAHTLTLSLGRPELLLELHADPVQDPQDLLSPFFLRVPKREAQVPPKVLKCLRVELARDLAGGLRSGRSIAE